MHRRQLIIKILNKQQAWSRSIQHSQSGQQAIAENLTLSTLNSKAKGSSSILTNILAEWERAKPFKKIPGPSRFQLIRGFMRGGEFENLSFFELLARCRQKYGDIFLLPSIGKPSMLSVFDPADIERIHRTEGKYPQRPGIDAIAFYLENRKKENSKENINLATSNEDWADFRSKVNPVMMKPQNARLYLEPINGVIQDFTQHIRDIRDPVTEEVPENFFDDITRLTLETLAAVALDTRLGLITNKKLTAETQKLFEALEIVMQSIFELGVKPSLFKYIRTPTYKRFEKAMDLIDEITGKHIDKALEKLKFQSGVAENKSILEILLKIDRTVAKVMAGDIMKAGVETTSSALGGALLLLATNRSKQSKLRSELLNALGKDSANAQFTYENMQNLPYLRACIKEALRIYPIINGNLRSTGMDVVLSGYRVPKDTPVVMNSNMLLLEERYFPRAKEFIPERWLRGSNAEHLMDSSMSPFIFLPFGFGPRSCVGKRIASLDIELVLANLVKNFSIEYNYPAENAFKYKFFSYPAVPMKLKFSDFKGK